MTTPEFKCIAKLGACLILLASCETKSKIIDDKAIADEVQTENWLAYGRTHNERRFSPATDINVENGTDLKVDWFMDLPKDVGLVSTPLVVDGVLFFTGTMNSIRAINATTGALLWEFDPKVRDSIRGRRQVGMIHNRGISYSKGKLFLATWDGRLIALDASNGKEIWSTVTFGPDRAL